MGITGKPLVSDTNLRVNMPLDVKKMSDRYKEMCSCITCLKTKMCQESLVRFRKTVLQQLKRAHDRAKCGISNRRRIAKANSKV